jgi:uncharacterized protein (DUF1800 family)
VAGSSWGKAALSAVVLGLSACGGGGGGGSGGTDSGSPVAAAPAPEPLTDRAAARFLAQASFGPSEAAIAEVMRDGLAPWLERQFAQPQQLHRAAMDHRIAERAAANEGGISQDDFFESWWQQAVTGPDAFRQRAAFALSQIFVVSMVDATVGGNVRGVASYVDMLGAQAFGNYRDLLQAVALHPMMGIYLSHLRNQKENAATGRVPDENFAREVMQLFSIGLYELNADGSARIASGAPVETYIDADVKGLAKVFTGWSWYAGPAPEDRTNSRFNGGNAHADRDWQSMQAYNTFHSTSEKRFLGTVIPDQTGKPDAEADLKIALDTLFNHPNVGPFLCRQLYQRLVTSNPSPAAITRCSTAFNGEGGTPRGDMKAVWRAVLLDPSARRVDDTDLQYGRLREPVQRLAHWMRAFKASSVDAGGRFRGIGNTDDAATRLGQSPMRSGSVFNFYRPGYTPPNTSIASAGLVAPELQLTHEVTTAGYLNYLRGWVPISTAANRFVRQDYSSELALVDNVPALVERMNLLLMAGQMGGDTRGLIENAVSSRSIPAPTLNIAGTVTNQAAIDTARRDRVYIAVFLGMASPDYLVQR